MPLTELVAASSAVALSFEQRAFLVLLVEFTVSRLFETPSSLLGDVGERNVQLASKAFLDLCLRTLEHAASEQLASQGHAAAMRVAQRALAVILSLCIDVELRRAVLAPSLQAMQAQLSTCSFIWCR